MANAVTVAATDATGAANDVARDWVRLMPWACFAMVGVIAISSAVAVGLVSFTGLPGALLASRIADGIKVAALLILAALMIVWFIRAFTYSVGCETDSGTTPLEDLYRRQIFIFAYAFTFISFVVVAMPTGDLLGSSQSAGSLAGSARTPKDASQETVATEAKANSFAPITMFYGCFYYGDNAPERPIPQCDEITIRRVRTERLAKLKEQTSALAADPFYLAQTFPLSFESPLARLCH